MAAKFEITLADMDVDGMYEQLGKLRDIGFGKAEIEWHTSRGHLGKSITMTLCEADHQPEKKPPAGVTG